MRKYPLTEADIISREAIEKGRTNLVYGYKDVLNMVNSAFYDGFILALCDSKEAFDNITPQERVYAAFTAIQILAKFQGRQVEELQRATASS